MCRKGRRRNEGLAPLHSELSRWAGPPSAAACCGGPALAITGLGVRCGMDRRRSQSRYAVAAGAVVTAALVLLNVMLSVHLVALDLRFYRAQWARYGVPVATSMTQAELDRAGQALTGYFTGSAATPQIQAVINGQSRPLYNQTELVHLKDVQSLFSAGLLAERVLAVVIVAALLLLPKRLRRTLGTSLVVAGGLCVAVLVLLAIPAKMDFSVFWTDFHLVTFSNDLWLLDPNTDWLIKMFPEEFFFSTVERIGMYSAGISVLYVVFGFLVRHFSPDHRH